MVRLKFTRVMGMVEAIEANLDQFISFLGGMPVVMRLLDIWKQTRKQKFMVKNKSGKEEIVKRSKVKMFKLYCRDEGLQYYQVKYFLMHREEFIKELKEHNMLPEGYEI